MSKITVAFCEEDEAYRNRFVTYIMEHKAKEIAIYAFSAVKPFLEEAKKQKFDVILLGAGFAELARALWERRFPVLQLMDTVPEKVAEPDRYQDDGTVLQTVFRYQNMESIIHEIFILSQGKGTKKTEASRLSGIEVLGIYSPVRHEMQMPFSMVLSQFLAEKGKVLYLNMMENNGFMKFFGFDGEYDMGDLIVRIRDGGLTTENFWKCVYRAEKASYIPPFSNMENLHELLFADITALLRFIEEKSDIGTVVIDLGGGLDSFSKILEACTGIYCLVRNGFLYECQTKCFLEYLEKISQGKLKERLHLVDIPYSAKSIRSGGDVLRQLLYSEFGDYVRGCFSGQQCP